MSRWNLLKRYAAPAVGALLLLAPLLVAQEPKPDRAAPSARQTPDARPASPAVEPKPEAQEPAELTQIRAAARDYLKAIHDGDYAAASKFWNPEGDYVDSAGHTHKIRELFAKQAANAEPRGAARPGETGATPPSAAQKAGDSKPGDSKPGDRAAPAAATPLPTVGTLRLVTPDVAIEDGSWRPPAGAARRSAYSRFTAIWTRHDGRWQLDSLREAVMTNISPAARLHALEWLIGEWTATQGPVQLKMTCAWGPDRNFIVRELRGGTAADRTSLIATQYIGWDAISGRIKSWSFESDGSWGDAFWGHSGDAWTVRAMTVHPDGTQVTASNTYTLVGRDHLRLDSTDVAVGGEPRPDTSVEFHRQ